MLMNADVEKKIFVKMPPEYERRANTRVLLVMKFKKSIYGLRQSSKNLFSTMDQCLGNIRFRPIKSDLRVYIYEDEVC